MGNREYRDPAFRLAGELVRTRGALLRDALPLRKSGTMTTARTKLLPSTLDRSGPTHVDTTVEQAHYRIFPLQKPCRNECGKSRHATRCDRPKAERTCGLFGRWPRCAHRNRLARPPVRLGRIAGASKEQKKNPATTAVASPPPTAPEAPPSLGDVALATLLVQ